MLRRHIKVKLGVARYQPIAIELGRQIQGLVAKQISRIVGNGDDGEDCEVDDFTGEIINTNGTNNIIFDL